MMGPEEIADVMVFAVIRPGGMRLLEVALAR